jgi:hypothetical protein
MDYRARSAGEFIHPLEERFAAAMGEPNMLDKIRITLSSIEYVSDFFGRNEAARRSRLKHSLIKIAEVDVRASAIGILDLHEARMGLVFGAVAAERQKYRFENFAFKWRRVALPKTVQPDIETHLVTFPDLGSRY